MKPQETPEMQVAMTSFLASSRDVLQAQIRDTDRYIERLTEQRAAFEGILVDVVAMLDAAHGEHGPIDELLASLVARTAVLAEDAGERELRRRCATSAPPAPVGVRPDLTRPMTYVDAVTLARQFLGLYEMPEAGDASWRGAIAKTGVALAAELERLFAEPYDDGTPITGAGCT